MADGKRTVAVVDDDQGVREAVTELLKSVGLQTETFACGEDFLSACRSDAIGCIVLDLRMPGASGLEVQKELSRRGVNTPIVMISGYGLVPEAVETMRLGAISFLEKPFRNQELLDSVHEALRRGETVRQAEQKKEELKNRCQLLTPREREVLDHLLAGATAKEVAARLGIRPKTVDYHRAHILDKMQVHTLTELMAQTMPCESLH